jgi:bifunctional DNase/RNase
VCYNRREASPTDIVLEQLSFTTQAGLQPAWSRHRSGNDGQEISMIEVTIDSIRVSLMSQHRIVVLKEQESERFLPIWIGPFEADAITLQLQGMEAPRPLTHDLLKSVLETLGGEVVHILISGLEKNTYFARIVLDVDGDTIEIDSRPSDAIALAVRVGAPVFVADEVMEQAGMQPEEEVSLTDEDGEPIEPREGDKDSDLGAFSDFVEGLDLDSLLGN